MALSGSRSQIATSRRYYHSFYGQLYVSFFIITTADFVIDILKRNRADDLATEAPDFSTEGLAGSLTLSIAPSAFVTFSTTHEIRSKHDYVSEHDFV